MKVGSWPKKVRPWTGCRSATHPHRSGEKKRSRTEHSLSATDQPKDRSWSGTDSHGSPTGGPAQQSDEKFFQYRGEEGRAVSTPTRLFLLPTPQHLGHVYIKRAERDVDDAVCAEDDDEPNEAPENRLLPFPLRLFVSCFANKLE